MDNVDSLYLHQQLNLIEIVPACHQYSPFTVIHFKNKLAAVVFINFADPGYVS